jgi:hypothetical protein
MSTKFDIFKRLPDGKSCRITATASFEEAEKRVESVSSHCTGELFDYSETDGGIVERVAA